ncbi:2Fe-2S iron-sulfur cluster protein [Marinomonas alcarazii]|uniref:2Fe-2S iron-sulfur cluster protein n=1 Tax=Marinomonas alcarazii TaxID=491949 RepID=A0A318V3H6_9GAMM|nr:2Fe-2S iron-sulfur cluster binding domain-containing protein [Marinomonas alcarazii]PYF82301.1 2Fe-2S iron-sulfur cluster protein [Marinomonas alcarazii]
MLEWITGKKVEIIFNEKIFTGSTKKTVLQSAIENKIPIRYNCGSGVCGQCAITLNSGEVKSNNKILLACQCYPDSNINISQKV